MKHKGIPIGLATIKDGKLVRVHRFHSASQKIAQRKSKKVRVIKRTAT